MSRATILSLVLLCFGTTAQAQERVEPPGHELAERFETNFNRVHDRGLALALAAGVGWGRVATPAAGGVPPTSSSGARAVWGVEVGGLLAEGVALSAAHWGWSTTDAGQLALGPSLRWYPWPERGWYLTPRAGVAASRGVLDAPGAQWSLSGELSGGHVWWSGPAASLGLELYAGGEHLDLDRDGRRPAGWRAGLRLAWHLN